MDILNAALAFAVLMITLSTAATALSEAILRATSQRPKVLALAVLQFIKTDPRIKEAVKNATTQSAAVKEIDALLAKVEKRGKEASAALEDLIERFGTLTEAEYELTRLKDNNATNAAQELEDLLAVANSETDQQKNDATAAEMQLKEQYGSLKRAKEEAGRREANEGFAAEKAAVKHLIENPAATLAPSPFFGSKNVDTLTTYAFVQRLAETDIGKAFGEEIEARTLKALTRSFERFNAAANELFRKRARTMTMASAILLAFSINVPATPIFRHLFENQDVSQTIIADIEEVAKEAGLIENGDEGEPAPPEPENEGTEQPLDEIVSIITDTRGTFGLPLGYSEEWLTETCGEFKQKPLIVTKDTNLEDRLRHRLAPITHCTGKESFWFWALNVVLSGLLIGLGGPFWYRVYASLSHSAQLVRAFRGNPRPETLGTGNKESQLLHSTMAEDAAGDGEGETKKKADVNDQLLDLFKTNLT